MTSMFDAILEVAKASGKLVESVTTGAGSVTTLVDSRLTVYGEEHFTDGLLFIIEGDLADSVLTITDFAESTGTLTFATQANAPGSGKRYAIFPKHTIGLLDLQQAVNLALSDYGPLVKEDTSLTTVDGQQTYTLPAGVTQVRQIHLRIGSSEPYNWQQLRQWREIDGSIVIDPGYEISADSMTLRLRYMADHAYLESLTDDLDAGVNLEFVKWCGLFFIAQNMLNRFPSDQEWNNLLLLAQFKRDKVRRGKRKQELQPHHIFMSWLPGEE